MARTEGQRTKLACLMQLSLLVGLEGIDGAKPKDLGQFI